MYRSIFSIGLFITIYSTIGLLTPHAALYFTVLLPDGFTAAFGILAGLLLCNFAVVTYFRKRFYKMLFGLIGFGLAFAGALGLIQPMYFGLLSSTVRPADLFIFMQSGIGLLIASLEYYRPGFQAEIGIPYRRYLSYVIARPTLLAHGFKKRSQLVVAALDTSARQQPL